MANKEFKVKHGLLVNGGNVGIGNEFPTTTLHAATGTDGSGLIDVLRLENSGDTVNDGPRIQLTAGASTSGAGIGALGVSSNSAHLVLHAGGNNERMRIEADGNVGIGTTDPNCLFHVEDSSDHVVARLKAGGTDKQASLRLQNDAQQWGVQCQTSDHFQIENLTVSNIPFQMNPDGYLVLNRNANEYGLQIRSAGTRSGLVIDKPGTSTIMGSALVIGADERFKLGTASYYHIEMKQNGDTKINNNLLLSDNFGLRAYSGYFAAGTSTGNFDFNTYGAGCYEVTAAFGHYGYIDNYGCFRKAICSNGAGYSSSTSITVIDIATEIHNSNGGRWSFGGFSSGSNSTSHIRVSKSAGSYGGGGYYFVEVRGNQSA